MFGFGSRNKSVFLSIYKLSRYSKTKTLVLINKLILEYETGDDHTNKGLNFFNNNPLGNGSSAGYAARTGASLRLGNVGVNHGESPRKKSKNIRTLKKLRSLYGENHQITSDDIWDK